MHQCAGERLLDSDTNPAQGDDAVQPPCPPPLLLLLLAALAWQRRQDGRCDTLLRQAGAVADELLAGRGAWEKAFPDDNIWHPATAGETNLLKRAWAVAARQYRAALAEP